MKTETNDHLLSLEAAAFLIDWKNIQLLAQIDKLGVNVNGGAARSKGIEFTAGLNQAARYRFMRAAHTSMPI